MSKVSEAVAVVKAGKHVDIDSFIWHFIYANLPCTADKLDYLQKYAMKLGCADMLSTSQWMEVEELNDWHSLQ